MLKFVVVISRKTGWEYERFRTYFIDVHGALAGQLPGLRRYVQNFPVRDPNRAHPRWDAVIELYFDDYDAMQLAWKSPQGERATEDLRTFAELSACSWSVVDERVIREADDPT